MKSADLHFHLEEIPLYLLLHLIWPILPLLSLTVSPHIFSVFHFNSKHIERAAIEGKYSLHSSCFLQNLVCILFSPSHHISFFLHVYMLLP